MTKGARLLQCKVTGNLFRYILMMLMECFSACLIVYEPRQTKFANSETQRGLRGATATNLLKWKRVLVNISER